MSSMVISARFSTGNFAEGRRRTGKAARCRVMPLKISRRDYDATKKPHDRGAAERWLPAA